jgi:GT2 family glycosyltransferase
LGFALQPEVSVIIVNWNTREFLRDCLHSVIQQTQRAHEIIVIDNGSTDASATMTESEFPGVRLIANNRNRGFAAANNQGIKLAAGRYILLLNPDTTVLDNAIDKMISWLEVHPNVGCAGCQVLENDSTIQKTCFGDPDLFNLFLVETRLHRVFEISRPEYAGWDRRSEKDVDVVSGMFMLIPSWVLGMVGTMDERFFVYAEEADLCRRIRKAGFRCVFTPVAQILHRDGGNKSTDQIKPQMHVQLQKSKLIYIKKHYGSFQEYLARMIFVLSSATSLAISLLMCWKNKDMRTYSLLMWRSLLFHVLDREPK